MSKNSRQSNLFTFFNKTPKAEPIAKEERSNTTSRKRDEAAMKTIDMEVEEISPIKSPACSSKRRRLVISSDEEDIDDKIVQTNVDVKKTPIKVVVDKENQTFQKSEAKNDIEVEMTPSSRAVRTPLTPKNSPHRKIGAFADSFIGSFRFEEDPNCSTSASPLTHLLSNNSTAKENFLATKKSIDDEVCTEDDRFPHLDYAFLKPDRIRDAERHRPTDPDYDPKTLYVPDDFLRQQTPGHMQWWKFKSAHFDTLLFFKVGKFYELYHMDAVVAVESLNLTYMRGKYAHCGFPEIGYGRFADQLVNRGFKVARVEQTETPQQLDERCRRTNVKEKVVRREICRLTTTATRTYGILDGTDDREVDGAAEPEANYLMAITERVCDSSSESGGEKFTRYGVSFVDCSTGQFYLSEFKDDKNHTSLRTLLAHNYPSQLLYEKDAVSDQTLALFGAVLCDVPQQALFTDREFWSAETTLKMLNKPEYFANRWPSMFTENGLVELSQNGTALTQSKFKLSMSALGAVVWYLKGCLIDMDLITMRNFQFYIPANLASSRDETSDETKACSEKFWRSRRMILDGTSLLNLHILPARTLTRRASVSGALFDNSVVKFSLFNTINHCVTAFGRRMLQRWICSPSCDPQVLRERQDAVRVIVLEWSIYGEPFINLLRKIPDLERLFQRIHTLGSKHRAENHPDARAQLFEGSRYNQRKIKDLVLALDGLKMVEKLQDQYREIWHSQKNVLLDDCVGTKYTEMYSDLRHFNESFDRVRALEEGVIMPHRNVDREYDCATIEVKEAEDTLNEYLTEQQKFFKCSTIKYIGSGKSSYQMEIPDSACAKINSKFTLLSQRKGFKRYTTDQLEELKSKLFDAKKSLNDITGEVTRRVFNDFDERKEKWQKVVENIAIFDCILSLARYSKFIGLKMCFPEFVFDSPKPFLEIRAGYHPSLLSANATGGNVSDAATNYIPNDCVLGTASDDIGGATMDAKSTTDYDRKMVMLLTGANMGGKSTLMRQVSSLVVLAQMGSMVPADYMRLTPVDRIFCRIGASDRLTAGQSTFFVELSETNVILKEATQNSLVLIDELGRGTSTHDGTAIAFAVLKHIASEIRCRTIFSTHFHPLCRMVENSNANNDLSATVKLAHMACMSENENTDDPTEENITFLYTLTAGPAPKSYGFYTAKVAGINVEIVRRAFAASNSLKSC